MNLAKDSIADNSAHVVDASVYLAYNPACRAGLGGRCGLRCEVRVAAVVRADRRARAPPPPSRLAGRRALLLVIQTPRSDYISC